MADAYPPLLFTLPSEQPAEFRTPRSIHSPSLRDASGSISTARRSVTPPGSVHTDTTPPRPPPIARLQDAVMMDAEPSGSTPPGADAGTPFASAAGGGGGGTPLRFGGGGGGGIMYGASTTPGAAAGGGAAAAAGGVMRVEHLGGADDTWVTVFGFTQDDLPLVLKEFQRCGDVLQWGTFGAAPGANFVHLQFANKYAASRALLRSGEQLSAALIVGVKPLEPRHRALVDGYAAAGGGGVGGGASPASRMRPVRPYRVDASAAQALPQRSRTLAQKLSEFVLGL